MTITSHPAPQSGALDVVTADDVIRAGRHYDFSSDGGAVHDPAGLRSALDADRRHLAEQRRAAAAPDTRYQTITCPCCPELFDFIPAVADGVAAAGRHDDDHHGGVPTAHVHGEVLRRIDAGDLPALAHDLLTEIVRARPDTDESLRQTLDLAEKTGQVTTAVRRYLDMAPVPADVGYVASSLADLAIAVFVTAAAFGIDLPTALTHRAAVGIPEHLA